MLEQILKKVEKLFEKKPLKPMYPLFEALDSFLLTPGKTAPKAPHVRDSVDLKRVMIFVVIGLVPCISMGVYNTGYQMLLAQGQEYSLMSCVLLGLSKVLPIIMVAYMAGGFWEVLFAVVRKHEINEGFLVTGMLYSLIMPPTIPLWQVAVGISFGVVIGKEIFGGTGYNVLNPALVGRAFLFFAYPAQFSGDGVWVAVDGFTKATPLAVVTEAGRGSSAIQALAQSGYTLENMFLGFIPGVIGETSTLACVLGLIFLLVTRVANWRIVVGCLLGLVGMSAVFYVTGLLTGSESTPAYFTLPPHWHIVMGGFAFGAIFMATDPVSSSATQLGRWIYGTMIGVLIVLVRVTNPAYTEGVMLSILFMNIFAPLIDHFVVQHHIRKRSLRAALKE